VSTCPKCQKTLLPFEYEGIELLKCSDCGGFWFKGGKFREVKQVGFSGLSGDMPPESLSAHSSQSSSAPQEMMCPDCNDPLVPYTYAYSSDIQLYRCTQCRGIWADHMNLLRIEELLTGYKESLDEAKAKALPLMLKVKKQIQQEERTKEEERKRRKKGVFNRLFGQKNSKNRKIENIFEDVDNDDDEKI
jgi:Zn-finger nucleic acid-binding protein